MCSKYNPLCDLGGVVGGVADSAANSAFGVVADAFGKAAVDVCSWMWSAISATTVVPFDGGWFTSTLGLTATLAAVMVAGLFVAQVVKGALQRDPSALGRAVTGCGVAFLGAAGAVIVTSSLLVVVDKMSDGIVRTAGLGGIAALGRTLTPVVDLPTLAPALVIVLGFFFMLASILVWGVFLTRKAMLIVAAVFAPVAFGGATADATRAWVRKWVEFTVAMVFSKLAMVVIFTLGVSLIATPVGGAVGIGNLFSGLTLLLVASFTPWLLFRFVHFIGGEVITAHHAGARAATGQAGSTPVRAASMLKTTVAAVVGEAAAGGGAAVAPRVVPALAERSSGGATALTGVSGGVAATISGKHAASKEAT